MKFPIYTLPRNSIFLSKCAILRPRVAVKIVLFSTNLAYAYYICAYACAYCIRTYAYQGIRNLRDDPLSQTQIRKQCSI